MHFIFSVFVSERYFVLEFLAIVLSSQLVTSFISFVVMHNDSELIWKYVICGFQVLNKFDIPDPCSYFELDIGCFL